MRIGLDAHMVGRRETGNETYVVRLARAMAGLHATRAGEESPGPIRHAFVANRAAAARLGPGWRCHPLWPGGALSRYGAQMAVVAAAEGLDVLHTTYVAPPLSPCATVVMVHDCGFAAQPERFSPRVRLLLRLLVPWSARRAERVIVPSRFSADELVRWCGVPRGRIAVVPNGGVERAGEVEVARREAARRRYAEGQPFLLAVGSLHAKKNLPVLVHAFARLRSEGFPHLLLLAGPAGWGEAAVAEAARAAGVEWAVRRTGYLAEDDLQALYAAAAVLAHPSRYEGFGLPPLEAMAHGTPVVAAAAGSIPEVVGDAALLVPPDDPAALAAALRQVLTEPGLRAGLVARGRARAAHFSWERAARVTLDVYAEAIALRQEHRLARAREVARR